MKNLSNTTILVTGGTGFIGKSLCKTLVENGARVFVLTRSAAEKSREKITYISSPARIREIEPDIIINLAGETIAQRWTVSAKERIRKSRIDITAAMIDYIKSAPKKPTLFICASAIGYYGTDATTTFDEASPPSSSGGLFSRQLCAAYEAEALKAEQFNVRTVLLRIGAVLEKKGGMLGKLVKPFNMGVGGPIGHGQQWLSWIDRDDLVDLILYVIRTPSMTGAINATAPNPVSNHDFSKTLASVLGRPCLFRIPAFVLHLVFADMADEIMLEGQKVLPRKALENGFVFSYPSLASSLQKIVKAEKK